MESLNICSYNVRNDNLSTNLTEETIKNIYGKLIYDYKINILNTQEMVSKTAKIIQENLLDYNIHGSYRYQKHSLLRKIKKLKKYNEGNNIITNLSVLTERTSKLPWIPRNLKELIKGLFKYHSIIPRIITEVIAEIPEFGKVKIINTHLSHHLKQTVKLQLNSLINQIKNTNIPVILTGDFNLGTTDKMFQKFIGEIEKIGMKRVEINKRTFKKSKNNIPIDHIFIPYNWIIQTNKIIKDSYLENYSDHYPIIVSVTPKSH